MATKQLILAGVALVILFALTGQAEGSRVDAMRELEQRIESNIDKPGDNTFTGL
jgi:hypothetical protein